MATSSGIMKKIRLVAWAAIAVIAIGYGVHMLGIAQKAQQSGVSMPGGVRIGGPFELTRSDGSRYSSAELAGKPYALFIGFTHCPDICPTTLMEMTEHLQKLGPRGKDINVLFVSVDPARDTAEHLKDYMSAFDPRIIGLTGTPEEIAAVAKAYRIFFEKVPSKDGSDYTMNHTASVYLMDKAGNLVSTLSFQEPQESRQKKIENVLDR